MLFYAEKANRPGGEPGLLDVHVENGDWGPVLSRLKAGAESDPSRTLMAIRCNSPRGRGLVEGRWYELANDFFDRFTFRRLDLNAVHGELCASGIIEFPRAARPRPNDLWPAKVQEFDFPKLVDWDDRGLELAVVKCGQGNWNEVYTTDWRLVYDTGADWKWTREQVEGLVREQMEAEVRPVMIVLSHWDVDHYQALERFSDPHLGRVVGVFAPCSVPATKTAYRVIQRVQSSGVRLQFLPFAPGDGTRKVVLQEVGRTGPVTWLRGSKGESRNQTGIALYVRGRDCHAYLTGDHHYERLADVMPRGRRVPLRLVLPHHGGEAGRPSSAKWRGLKPVAISYGFPNVYGHPKASNVAAFSWAGVPWETALKGTGRWPL